MMPFNFPDFSIYGSIILVTDLKSASDNSLSGSRIAIPSVSFKLTVNIDTLLYFAEK
jgi:hypothetical protein